MFASMSGLESSSLGLGKEVEFTEVTEEEGELGHGSNVIHVGFERLEQVCTSVVWRRGDWHWT